MRDVKHEIKTGHESNIEIQKRITTSKMITKFIKLLWKGILSNLDMIAYMIMIIQTIINPGVCTLVYPFSIFGYALLMETRPSKYYWYFILAYTQLLMIVEFVLSLSFFDADDYQQLFNQYFLGLEVVNGDDAQKLLVHFAPKVLILYTVMNSMLNEISLGLFNEKEEQKEPVQSAYVRFIKGQFGVEIDHFVKFDNLQDDHCCSDSDDYIMVDERKYTCDFDINYGVNDPNCLDIEEIHLLSKKFLKTDYDAFSYMRGNNIQSDSSRSIKSNDLKDKE